MTPGSFREFFSKIEPIRMYDPLATLLGTFKEDHDIHDIIEYHFIDVIKMAGHSCPTTASAFVACKYAMRMLFEDGIGERGAISIMVHGERDSGVYGVIAQVFSFITGACSETGFKGLGGLHRRNNLLWFGKEENKEYQQFDFTRRDTKRVCVVRSIPGSLPLLEPSESLRLNELFSKNVWEAVRGSKRAEFRDLWMKRVKLIALDEQDRESWLKLEMREA